MSLINKIAVLLFCLLIVSEASAQEIKKVGKFKDWETIEEIDGEKKLCFAPVSYTHLTLPTKRIE